MSRLSKNFSAARTSRARLVVGAFIVALVALTTALALAQEQGPEGATHATTTTATTEHGAAAAAHETTEAEGEHAGAEHAEGEHHGPASMNWTNIWDHKRPAFLAVIINFGVLMAVYYMLARKPVTAALKQRRVTIGKDIDDAQALLAEAKERAKKYQADLKNADADATTAKVGLIAAGKGEIEHLLLEAQERADRMKRDADRLVEQERKQLQLDLLNETVDLAVTEASQLLQKTVTADDHARLAQDLLAELASRPAAKSAMSGGAT